MFSEYSNGLSPLPDIQESVQGVRIPKRGLIFLHTCTVQNPSRSKCARPRLRARSCRSVRQSVTGTHIATPETQPTSHEAALRCPRLPPVCVQRGREGASAACTWCVSHPGNRSQSAQPIRSAPCHVFETRPPHGDRAPPSPGRQSLVAIAPKVRAKAASPPPGPGTSPPGRTPVARTSGLRGEGWRGLCCHPHCQRAGTKRYSSPSFITWPTPGKGKW